MDEFASMFRTSISTLKTFTHAVVAMIDRGSTPAILPSSEIGPEGRPSGTAVQLAGGIEEYETVSPLILASRHCNYALLQPYRGSSCMTGEPLIGSRARHLHR